MDVTHDEGGALSQNEPSGPPSGNGQARSDQFLRYQSLPSAAIGHIVSQMPIGDAFGLLTETSLRSRAAEIISYALISMKTFDFAFLRELLQIRKKISATDASEKYQSLWRDIQAASWPDLKIVKLEAHPGLTQKELVAIIFKSPGLRVLNLRRYPRITDEILIEIAAIRPQLQALELMDAQITDVGITEFAKHCNDLRLLALSGLDYVTDVGIVEVAKHCKSLQLFYPAYTFQITDIGIAEVVKRCKNIEEITLPGYRVTDAGASEVANYCKKLKTLNLIGTRITDAGIAELAKSCKNLEHLALITSPKITDAGLIEVAKHCKELRTLKLWCASHITDHGIAEVARHCKELKTLLLRDTRIQNATIEDLRKVIKDVQVSR